MAYRCLQEERSSPPRSIQGTEQTPADTAAERAAGALALAVLAPAGPPQLTILGHLEQDDKFRLSATCSSLRQASLAWFPEVTARMKRGITDVASLAAWLERHQGEKMLLTAQLNLTLNQGVMPDAQEWARKTIVSLPAHLVNSLTASQGLPAAASTLTALTSLSLDGWGEGINHLPVDLLRQLSRLRQLSIWRVDLDSADEADELLALPALKGLQALVLSSCSLEVMPRALSALSQLTALDLSRNEDIIAYYASASAPLAALQRLQSLDLSHCGLTEVPDQVSALMGLKRLDLSDNSWLNGSWQQLLPLTQLNDLSLSLCNLAELPEELSALQAVTKLNLSFNEELAGGWQHLLALTQLRDLNLCDCGLPAAPEQLSALTDLTRLDLRSNWHLDMATSWQHLAPLTRLRIMHLPCAPSQLPPELTAMPHLHINYHYYPAL